MRIFARPDWDTYELFIFHRDGPRFSRALPMTFETLEPNQRPDPEPVLRLEPDTAQLLIDELWRAGLRPTEGHGSAGQLGATERHLEDMRALVFKIVPAPPPAP